LCALVVDDEPAVVEYLIEALGAVGFDVDFAVDVRTARSRAGARTYDLYLIDKNLPDDSGLELARTLATGDGGVVIMSGYANLSSAVEAIRLGVADYLIKPFVLDDLHARVERVIDNLRLRRNHARLLDEVQHQNEMLAAMVVRDPLTNLFNHAHFHEALDREVERSRRHELSVALLLIDLDAFKGINQRLGHATGDAVLRAFGQILRGDANHTSFRPRRQDFAARYGGDQLALILPETTKAGACALGDRLRTLVVEQGLGPGLPPTTISVGTAAYPEDATSREDLIAAAGVALHAAKRGGRDRVVPWSAALAEASEGASELGRLRALERVIEERAFRHAYQPIVGADGALFAYEGLVRPTDPAFANPLTLFALAARAGKITPLGRVLRERCVAPMPELPPPTLLFINLHPTELHDTELAAGEASLLPWADRIVFEVTEAAEISDYDRTRQVIDRLRGHGFRIALDDVGSGYSGLNCLALLGPDFVKIDMAMVRGIATNPRSARLIRHLLEFARGEGMPVIAEGVETAAERDAVLELGVPYLQGYLFGRPQPPFAPPIVVPRHGST
jgi:diguanylate cyclase (GGDEF)-like protein